MSPPLSIKRKLMLIIMGVSTVALLLTSAAFLTYELWASRRSMVRDLNTLGEVTGNQSTAALRFEDRDNAQEILNALGARPNIMSACLYREGKPFAAYQRDPRAEAPLPRQPEADGCRFEQDHLVLFHRVFLNSELLGTVYLKSDLLELHNRLVRFAQIVLLVLVLTGPVILLLSFLLQRLISQPILELAATAHAVSTQRNYALRAVSRGQDELGQLIGRFNEMLAQIQQRDVALQEAHDKLERRVAERTQDLQLEIAERERTQQALEAAYNELRQTQQAVMQQDRLRALGQMASGIAHDINNALSPVVGFAQMLLDHEPGLGPRAKKQLAYIRTAGEDVAHIVARLREFYRRRDDHEPFLPLDLNRLAVQVIDMTRPRWRDIPQGKGLMIEMRSDFAVGLPQILGSESELREALTNLVLNAVDAMPEGGTLTVRTRLNELGATTGHPPTHVILEVIDTGIGMDEETRRRCLEPFFSTKGRRGTGMGLPMVYGVMERHEGKIEVLSEPGKGTIVQLLLPLPRRLKQPDTSCETRLPPPLHILCIDDEPLLRQLMKDLLESDGHTVQVADSGQSGINAFRCARRHRPFDVIITDLGMPFLDGRQVARILKAESPRTPVILLTGWGAFMKADGELPAHVDNILSKPPRCRELRQTLYRLFRKPATPAPQPLQTPG